MSSAFDWRAKAACRDKDPELFFPVGNTGAAYQQIEEAKAVCRTCKVIDACLKCALDRPCRCRSKGFSEIRHSHMLCE